MAATFSNKDRLASTTQTSMLKYSGRRREALNTQEMLSNLPRCSILTALSLSSLTLLHYMLSLVS